MWSWLSSAASLLGAWFAFAWRLLTSLTTHNDNNETIPRLVSATPAAQVHQPRNHLPRASMLPCEVDWIRHGERLDHVVKGWQGTKAIPRTDPPLSPGGLLQAVETGLHYRKLRLRSEAHGGGGVNDAVRCIRSSPYLRCLQTATIVAVVGFDSHGCSFVVDETLGDWQGTRLYPTGAPEVLWGSPGAHQQVAAVLLDTLQRNLSEALDALESSQALMRRHNLKPKSLTRWRSAGGGALRAMVEASRCTRQRISFPESLDAFRTRCRSMLNPSTYDGDSLATICVTHADVVDAVLSEGLPRVGHKFSGGLSVPYCSITSTVFKRESQSWELKADTEVGASAHLRSSGVALSFR